MCFSSVASFTAAGILIVLGSICLALIPMRSKDTSMTVGQKLALATVAAIPLIFGLHQLSEGLVWLDFDNQVAVECFAYTAYTFWPLYISLSMCVAEWTRNEDVSPRGFCRRSPMLSVGSKRWILVFHTVISGVVCGFAAHNLKERGEIEVTNVGGRLDYGGWAITGIFYYFASAAYVFSVVGSLWVSSLKYTNLMGWGVMISLIITLILWQDQHPSTWCYFAAILSSMVILIVWVELETYRQPEVKDPQPTEQVIPEVSDPEGSDSADEPV